eukprot:1188902-Amphidinium_carterae.1
MAWADSVDRFLPDISAEERKILLKCLTPIVAVGTSGADAQALADPSPLILKKEEGVWVGEELVQKLKEIRQHSAAPMCHYLLMEKIEAMPVGDVSFVREGQIVHRGEGLQEIGFFGTFLGDGGKPKLQECVGYLVRTKPPEKVDGGICKGNAVLDSLLLADA